MKRTAFQRLFANMRQRRKRARAAIESELLETRVLLSCTDGVDHDDHDHDVNEFGDAAHWIPRYENDAAEIASAGEAPPFPTNQTFNLSSLPGANHTIYLDFNGHTTSGTAWNTAYNNGNAFTTPAYDTDGNTGSFSSAEHEVIQRTWQRVAEDFAPFNVNVTTAEPPTSDLIKSSSSDTRWGIRVVIGDNTFYPNSAGGVAYLTSFNYGTDTPTYVFNESLVGVAEAASHEVGHTLGLSHDGTSSVSYYTGHGTGATGWAPIMGVGYNKSLVQWSKGEYTGANQTQDDLAIITQNNGFSYRADDHGGSTGAATSVGGSTASGIIERNTDRDYFQFTVGANGSIDIDPYVESPNLDILARLYNSAGTQIATSNPTGALDASFTGLAAGTYYVSVEGTGEGSVSGTGYSDYGSLGQYTLTITGGGGGGGDMDDQISEATPVTAGNTYTDSISDSNDVDMYAISVLRGQSITFAANEINNSGVDPEIRLFKGDGTQLAVDDDGGPLSFDSLLTYTFDEAGGTYYLGVAVYNNDGYDPITGNGDDGTSSDIGAYELVVTNTDPDDQISEATPFQIGSTFSGYISGATPDDVDMFEFTVNFGQTLDFEAVQTSGTLLTHMRLFDGNGTQLNFGSSFSHTFSTGGTYYIGVSDLDNDSYNAVTGAGDSSTTWYGTYDLTIKQPAGIGSDLIGQAGSTWWVAESNGVDGFINQSYGSWNPNAGWQDVQAGDVNGDGLTDVIGRTASGQWWVGVHTGSTYNTELWGYWVPSLNWTDVRVADVDGDGDTDIVGRASNGDWWVARSNGQQFTNERWGRWSPNVTWSNVMVADLDGDGNEDIIGQTPNGQWWAARSNGLDGFATELWGFFNPNANFQDIQVGDFNGDGNDDVAGRTGGGAWWIGVSNGDDGFTNQNWGSWAASAGWQDVMVADLNGDGNDDIIGRAQNGQWWAAESTGQNFTREYWGYWVPSLNWQDVNVIDVDQDGNHDLVGRAANGGLWVARSNGQNFTNQNWGFWNPNANWQNVMVGNSGSQQSPEAIVDFDDEDDETNIFG